MSIHLFKHNQEAYNAVTAMLEREKWQQSSTPQAQGNP